MTEYSTEAKMEFLKLGFNYKSIRINNVVWYGSEGMNLEFQTGRSCKNIISTSGLIIVLATEFNITAIYH